MTEVTRTKELLLHIVDRATWEQACESGVYAPASLQSEGFVHCSTRAQLLATAERHYSGRDDLVVLWIDPILTAVRLRWDEAPSGELFPHLYGPIPLGAVVDVTPFPRGPDGRFLPLGES